MNAFFKSVGDFFLGLWDFFVDLLKFLFVPSDDYFSKNFSTIQNNLSNKLGIDLSTLETVKGVTSSNPLDPITFSIMGYKLSMDLSFIKNVVPYSQAISTGLSSIFMCWYHYRQAYSLIRGTYPISGTGGGKGKDD